jgi:hypothetical protein
MAAKDKSKSTRGMMALLFFANWLFVVFLTKRLISPPHGDMDFLAKNIGGFVVATVMTGLMIHFTSRKGVLLLIPTMAVLALAVALS